MDHLLSMEKLENVEKKNLMKSWGMALKKRKDFT